MSAGGWFYVQDDKRLGPVGVEHIVHLVMTTALPASALVWRHGMSEWTEASQVPEIVALLPPPLPPVKKAAAVEHEPPPLPKRGAAGVPPAGSASSAATVAPTVAPAPPAATATPTAPATSANARIEELRHKLDKEPNPRLFGQLAEELRKSGDFAGAIRVCRDGFERGASYPSLRLTLGRSLLEMGELQAARAELEGLLQLAPDNILGERFLGECLEALGDKAGARTQYLKALALAPGDAQLVARLRTLHAGDPVLAGANGPIASAADAIGIDTPAHASPLGSDDPLAGMLDDAPHAVAATEAHAIEMPVIEVDATPAASDPKPIPLVPVEDSFEIERANDIAAGTTPERRGVGKRKAAEEKGGKKAPPPTPVFTDFPADLPAEVPLALGDAPVVPDSAPVAARAPASGAARTPTPAIAAAAAPSASAVTETVSPPPLPTSAPRASRPTAAAMTAPGGPPEVLGAPKVVPDVPIAWPTGRLADHEFADLIREVYSRHWTGLLTLNHMGVEKSVRVQDGRLVFAFSSARDDRLGELILRRGRITLQQYVEASRAMRKGIRLGTVLVEQGALDPRELVKVVMDHTQEIIFTAFQWTEGLYHFTEGAGTAEPITLKLSTPDVILEGIRRIDSWSRIERAVGSMETRYARARDYESVLGEMTLSLEKLSILTGLDAEQEVGIICRNSTLSHFEVCRTLWAFRVIGVVQRLV